MNKFMRYLIFILLIVGIAYAIYMLMQKQEAKVEVAPAQTQAPVSPEATKVAGDEDSTEAQVAQAYQSTGTEESSVAVATDDTTVSNEEEPKETEDTLPR